MKNPAALVLALTCLAACGDPGVSPTMDPGIATSASIDRKIDVIVVLNGHVKGKSADNKQRALGVAKQMGLTVTFAYGAALTGFAASIPEGRLHSLEKDPRVQFISADEMFSIESQILPTGIDRIDADQSSTVAGDGTGSVNVGIAIIDTGIDPSHPDLNVQGGINCSNGDDSYEDVHGHGTHAAGIAAARDNAIGVAGVAPGAPLYAVRVLKKGGTGTTSQIVCGIDWVVDNASALGIKVANMSLGGKANDMKAHDESCGQDSNDPLHVAICSGIASGITFVVSAGNDGKDVTNYVPASYSEVLTVTAVRDFDGIPGGFASLPTDCIVDSTVHDDEVADWSNFSIVGAREASHVIAAPGSCIFSTLPGNTYGRMSGTSMASPHAAGAVALCIASGHCSGGPAQNIQTILHDAATRPVNTGFDGDPDHPRIIDGVTRYYGYLLYAGRY